MLAIVCAGPGFAQWSVLPAPQVPMEERTDGESFRAAELAWFSAPLSAARLHDEQKAARGTASGDTFSLAPIVQDAAVPANAFAMTSPTASTVTATGSASTNIGTNFYGSAGGTFRVDTIFLEDTPSEGFHIVEVCVVALDSSNAREPWVEAGRTGPGGETLYTWRLDLGLINATNPIDFESPVHLVDAYTLAFDVSGGLLLDDDQVLTEVGDQSVSGVTLLQFQIEGVPVEIAGFDLAEICLGWELVEVIFVDGFESGNTQAW